MIQIGFCGLCHSMQSYHWGNMIPMDWDDEWMASLPDVYEGHTWFCQGCGSSTSIVIAGERAAELSE